MENAPIHTLGFFPSIGKIDYLIAIIQINSTFASQHLPLEALYCSKFCLILQRCSSDGVPGITEN